jgi:chromosome segregation ATPase
MSKALMALLAVALLGVFATSSAYASSDDDALSELQARVNGLESLVKDLSISVMQASKSLEAQANGLQPRIFNVENMVKDLSFDVKKTVAAMADMQGHVGALLAQVEEFQPLVIKLQSVVVGFGDKLMYLTNDIDSAKVDLANVIEFSHETDARVTVLGDHLGGQLAALSDEFAKLYSMSNATQAAVETNSGSIGELHEAVVSLNVRVDSNTESIYENHEALEHIYGAMDEKFSDVESYFGMVEEKFGEVHMQHGVFDERVGKLERAVDELNILGPTLASLRNTVAGLAARADRVDARLGRLEDAVGGFAEATAVVQQIAANAEGLSGRVDGAEAMIADIKAAINSLATELAAGLSAVAQSQTPGVDYGEEVSFLISAVQDLQDQIDRLKISVNAAGSGSSVDQGQLDDLRGKIGQLVIELEASKMEISTLREQVATNSSVTTIDKEQIVSEIRTEIRSEISDLSGIQEQIDQALKTANSANGLALLALLAGVAAIALNLLL